jgi:hypothetical protein
VSSPAARRTTLAANLQAKLAASDMDAEIALVTKLLANMGG